MDKFLSQWYGVLAFVLFDITAFIFIVALTYRWFFKRIFDFFVSLVCIVALSPLYLCIHVRARKAKKRGEIERILFAEEFIGKKGKVVSLHRFSGKFGKYDGLARLLDVFLGKMSVIGYEPLTEAECERLTEVEFDRHLVKAGLIHPYKVLGVEKADMLKADEKYAWNFSFFTDMKIFFTWLLKKIRGQD